MAGPKELAGWPWWKKQTSQVVIESVKNRTENDGSVIKGNTQGWEICRTM